MSLTKQHYQDKRFMFDESGNIIMKAKNADGGEIQRFLFSSLEVEAIQQLILKDRD